MIRVRRALLLGVLPLVLACASHRDPGRAGVDAGKQLPGWIEFVLEDRDIPADPLSSAAGAPEPPTCDLEVLLNDESVVSLALVPSGDSPPYSLSSRFRIRAYPGRYDASVHYSSCRNFERRPDSLEAHISLVVAPGGLTRAHFDGVALSTRGPELLLESRQP